MAHRHGTTARFYYHTLDFSDYVEEVDPSFEREMAEHAVLSDTWKRNLPGLRTFGVSLGGIYDSSAGAIDPTAWAMFGENTQRPFAWLPDGDVLARKCYVGVSNKSSLQITAANDVIKMPTAAVGSGLTYRGEILHTLSQESTTSQGAAQDGGAASNYGAVAYLICTEYTDLTDITVLLEHSDDDISYSTLVSFTALTDVGSESKTVAAGAGSVKRYVRAAWTVTGTGTATFFVAWYRKTS